MSLNTRYERLLAISLATIALTTVLATPQLAHALRTRKDTAAAEIQKQAAVIQIQADANMQVAVAQAKEQRKTALMIASVVGASIVAGALIIRVKRRDQAE